ncbi:MAG: HlyD family efflux transporter periplasmic adaptor subunit [Peptoniphilaceae bacterium]|uniref:HlyD family efflux transporter periplasmic adaptor subunit n=1 Tax=Parvimonas sp. TaxID=1944660 RepID=UPI002A74F2AF|nr:HlyD family efflux transporter periplasmic adaptor subunit [Parvimonas sp.]MDD7764307.1 HlyD family efflux transporter periplasmic adaptor subunit [Peptoniphilaceae bacterium]MDY3050006.1 HlyD family efflux transporter periplasmic adaptor subunit [Parvimonas sp.]
MKKKIRLKYLLSSKKNIFFIIFVLFISLFFIKNTFFSKKTSDIIILESPHKYKVQTSAKALIIKDEYLYYVGNTDLETDNKKVEVNKTITEVDVSGINDNLKQYLSDKTSSLKSELENYNSESNLLNLDKILSSIRKKDYSVAFESLRNNKGIVYSKSVLKDKLLRYSALNDTVNSGKIVSQNSGILSTKIDGLENVYDFSIIDLLDEDDFNFENDVKKSEIFGVKIVDNLKYYLCLKVKSGMSENIEINSIVNVNFGTNVVSGKVVNIKREKSNDLVIAEFSKGFENVADKRFMDVNIEKTVDKSYELPGSSILYENGKYYVFTIDSFNNIKKVKVSVKFTDTINNKVYIDANNSYIGAFSNVLRNSQGIKESEILE